MLTEVQRLAYADRAIHLGDPDFYPSPVPMLISKEYAKKRLGLVSMDKATPSTDIAAGTLYPESTETTHYSAMDKFGNTVSEAETDDYEDTFDAEGFSMVPPYYHRDTGTLYNQEGLDIYL